MYYLLIKSVGFIFGNVFWHVCSLYCLLLSLGSFCILFCCCFFLKSTKAVCLFKQMDAASGAAESCEPSAPPGEEKALQGGQTSRKSGNPPTATRGLGNNCRAKSEKCVCENDRQTRCDWAEREKVITYLFIFYIAFYIFICNNHLRGAGMKEGQVGGMSRSFSFKPIKLQQHRDQHDYQLIQWHAQSHRNKLQQSS